MRTLITAEMKSRALYYELVRHAGCEDSQEETAMAAAESAAFALDYPYASLAGEICGKLLEFYPDGFRFHAIDGDDITCALLIPENGSRIGIDLLPNSRYLSARSDLFARIAWGLFPEKKAEEYCLRERTEMSEQEHNGMIRDFCSDLNRCDGSSLRIFMPVRNGFFLHGKSLFWLNLDGEIPTERLELPGTIQAEFSEETGIISVNPHSFPSMRIRPYALRNPDGPYTTITAELLTSKIPHFNLKNRL